MVYHIISSSSSSCSRCGSCRSEGLTLGVLGGADAAVALQGHGVVVQRRHAGLAARQAHSHVAGPAVCTHTVVAVDVGGVGHRFLENSHTHISVVSMLLLKGT